MKRSCTRCIVLFLIAFLPVAATAAAPDTPADSGKVVRAAKRGVKRADVAAPVEVFRDIRIDAGKALTLDSSLDFTYAARVAVTLRSDGEADSDLSALVLQPYWSVPDADHFDIVETKPGKEFVFSNTGGALFECYGTEFRLVLRNTGTKTVSLLQVVILARQF